MNCLYYTLDVDDKYIYKEILKKRCYYLIKNPKYVLIHYLNEPKKENRLLDNPDFLGKKTNSGVSICEVIGGIEFMPHIKIIDFSPNYILENTNSKIIIVIESYLNFQNLKMLENEISIKFSENLFMPCKIINSTVISSIIPCGLDKDIMMEIYLGKEKISVCDVEMKLKLIKNNSNKFFNDCHSSFNKKDSPIFSFSINQLKENLKKIFEEIKCYVIFFYKKEIPSGEYLEYIKIDQIYLLEEFKIILDELADIDNPYKKNLLYKLDKNGYNIIHYLCALNYHLIIELFWKYKYKLCVTSKDELTPYEIGAGKWNVETVQKLIELIDCHDNDDNFDYNEKLFYNIDILRSALNIALDTGKVLLKKNTTILELLLKQIKIQFTVDTTSGSIIKAINENINLKFEYFSNGGDENAKFIQKYVRRWLRRSRYNGIKKATKKLQRKIKDYVQRKKFLSIKNATIKIQKTFRIWNKNKNNVNK